MNITGLDQTCSDLLFFQVTDPSIIPFVDIYEFKDLLGAPALNASEGYSMIQDVLSERWLLGKTVTDEELKKELIQAQS